MVRHNKIMIVVGAGLLLAGCATKEMKSTPFYEGSDVEYVGDASGRVNLWPLAYWRDPVGAVAWPLVAFSDDHFAFRPIYSQYKQSGASGAWDEFNFVWPIAQADTKHNDYRFFPVFWGWDSHDCGYQAVFPIYWNGPTYNSLFPLWYYGSTTNSWTFHTLAGLAGASRTKTGYRASWTFPLWYEDNTGLFSTLVYGQTKDSHWVFPLWYWGEKAFVSPLYAQGKDGNESWWAMPALLSWGEKEVRENYSRNEGSILLGLGGWDNAKCAKCESGNWWAFPFIQRKWTEWNPPVEPKVKPTTETSVVCHLSGWRTYGDELDSLYVFPLFGWWDNGSWLTLLGGQYNNSCGTTNTVITPLVGITSGKRTGGWAFPLWSHSRDADFDEKLALVDSPSLPDCIEVYVHTNDNKKSKQYGKTYLSCKCLHSADDTAVLLHDADHRVYGWSNGWYGSLTNQYEIIERYKRGHKLLLSYESERKVTFDLKTKAKLSDEEESEASFLLFLYQYEWSRNEKYTRHRVLWRLWDWEEEDGDVSLDVFPGFTYDSGKDGYTKTSFLWRLFRYERDPNAGTSVDFLFIPVWR